MTTPTLVERLRVHKDLLLCHEAADALEAQARMWDSLNVYCGQAERQRDDALAERDALRAELDREKTIVKSWLRANNPDGWIDDMRKELAAIRANEAKWEGAEGWEQLAWQLCAEENGEDACNELIWEGGPIPEPWGDRWLKYEDEAKRLIKLVREYSPVASPVVDVNAGLVELPKEDTEEANKAITSMLAEYQYPANPQNAGRAGWRAARLYTARTQQAPKGGE